MKAKLLILAVVLCAFVLCSCSKEDKNKATRQPDDDDFADGDF
jgi:outer membrane murein-binding lipoprotein Lpp